MGGLRIVAGALRGRRIPVPRDAGYRPTADRTREALFSILGERVAGARVLDAYAGSGALGFEALSRGAASAVFVESDPRRAEAIRHTAETLGLADRCRVVQGRVLHWIRDGAAEGPFDLVFADPPYAAAPDEPGAGEGPGLLAKAGKTGLLAEGGLLVLERSSRPAGREARIPAGLERVDRRRYGAAILDFYRRIPAAPRQSGQIGAKEGSSPS